MVLATHQHEGSTQLATRPRGRTGLARDGSHDLVCAVPRGRVCLPHNRRDLAASLILPISIDPPSQPAVDAASSLISKLGAPPVTLTLVHAGEQTGPTLSLPQRADWSWNQLFGQGDPVEWILAAGAEFDVDLIVMATKGQDSLLDILRGTTTERVLRGARCPLLALPVPLI